MTLPHFTFTGPTFFTDIRHPRMNVERGFFAGSDGNLRYACMDAAFYRYEIFERPSSSKFTIAAKALPPEVRVVANGQFYDKPPCTAGPCMKLPMGEVIIAHTVKPGSPPKQPDHRHLGQWDGRTDDAFQVSKGDPSAVTIPTTYNHAMGTLLPVIERGVPFGAKEIRSSTGKVVQHASPGIGSLAWRPAFMGFTIYGIHRSTQILFALTQQHADWTTAAWGVKLGDMIARLVTMGVDDAVLADSGTSSMMLVDGVVETMPEVERDDTMPTGGMFRLQTLKLQSGAATLTATADSSHPNFPPGTVLTGAAGTVKLIVGGSAVDLTSLGIGGSYSTPNAAMSALGLSSPVHLESDRSNLLYPRKFAAPPFQSPLRVGATLKISATKTTTGQLTGTLSVLMVPGNVSSPMAVFDVNCLLDI